MTVISFAFLVFLLFGAVIYYIVPRRGQWVVLLLMSIAFYLCAATPYTIVYLIASALIAWVSTNLMRSGRFSGSGRKALGTVTALAILANILIWFVLKGSSFWVTGSKLLHHFLPFLPVLPAWPYASAMGMGYYTAQVIGYILDCYWENATPQRNPLKLFLFVCFFPQMTVGPISRYSQLQSLYEKHRFSYQNLCFGSQRILWGFFKKLVIADRVGLIISTVWSADIAKIGLWPWIAVLLYPLQIYADFSGCADIVLGAAEIFGIRLPENFNNPFFSRTCQEFWQRWHITLGAWARDYVYYPVLKSAFLQRIGKWAKKRFGKRTAKLIPWALGMGVLWFVMGFWHGSVQHILGVSLWYWTILVLSEICAPLFKRAVVLLRINPSSHLWHLFQSVRTYVVYSIGAVFFSSPGLRAALGRFSALGRILIDPQCWFIFNSKIIKRNFSVIEAEVLLIGVLLLFLVAILREKHSYARNWVQKNMLPLRWLIWIALFVLVLIFGMYGPAFDASEFIYQGF